MVALTEIAPDDLVNAIRLWSGWGRTPFPSRDETRIRARYGEPDASALLAQIRILEADYYDTDANRVASDLAEMQSLASEAFCKKHPSLPREVVSVLGWCYTFDFR